MRIDHKKPKPYRPQHSTPYTPESVRFDIASPEATERAEICRGCPECRKVTEAAKGRPLFVVNCRASGCGGMSLAHGECPKKLW
jgi:hypothetical protein